MKQSSKDLLFDLAPGSELWRLTEYYRNMKALGESFGHSALALRNDLITFSRTIGLLATYPTLLYMFDQKVDYLPAYVAVFAVRHVLSGSLQGINDGLERLIDRSQH